MKSNTKLSWARLLSVLCSGTFLAAVANAGPSTLATYTFPGTPGSLAVTSHNPGDTATSVDFNGSTASQAAGAPAASLNILVGTGATTLAAAVADSSYFEFTVTPLAGDEMNLTSLTFSAAYLSTAGSYGYGVSTSLDNYAANDGSATLSSASPTYTPYSVTLSGQAFQGITAATTFRIYDFAPVSGIATESYESLLLNGTIVAVPEPSLLCFFGAGGLALLLRRRNHR